MRRLRWEEKLASYRELLIVQRVKAKTKRPPGNSGGLFFKGE
jgi:hypothetical protein